MTYLEVSTLRQRLATPVKASLPSPPLSQLRIDRWYDRSTDNWVVTLKDKNGVTWGDSIVVYRASEARAIKKDNPSFNLPKDDSGKYEVQFPPGLEKPCRALTRKIQLSPEDSFTVWDAKTRERMFVIREASSSTRLTTIGKGNARGVCGTIPLVRWMKSGLVRVDRGQQEVKFAELLRG